MKLHKRILVTLSQISSNRMIFKEKPAGKHTSEDRWDLDRNKLGNHQLSESHMEPQQTSIKDDFRIETDSKRFASSQICFSSQNTSWQLKNEKNDWDHRSPLKQINCLMVTTSGHHCCCSPPETDQKQLLCCSKARLRETGASIHQPHQSRRVLLKANALAHWLV